MNKWEKLLDGLTHLREGLEIAEELYRTEPQVRALLESRIPLLTGGGFSIVNRAVVDLTQQAMKLQEHAPSCKLPASHA